MNNNKLIVAAAGSGKTTFLINSACEKLPERVLITTYTEANESEILHRLVRKRGFCPPEITVQTWFSFLLKHGVRPYQSLLDDGIHDDDIGFYLSSEKSAKKLDGSGQPILVNGRPIYWGEKDFRKHYFTRNLKIYSDKISKFVLKINEASNGEVIQRISRLFDHIYVDEVQDLAGYDLELIKLLFRHRSSVLLVGDPRQVTYLTHQSTKYKKYADGKIQEFVENELGKGIKCDVDVTTLSASHRNNQAICDYSARLFPSLEAPKPCDCAKCRSSVSEHEGIFLVRQNDVEKYLLEFEPLQLRWSAATNVSSSYPCMNFGESKGSTTERVLIYPTKDMVAWIKNNNHKLSAGARAKLYVGITRARRSAAIVADIDSNVTIEGTLAYLVGKEAVATPCC